MGQLLSPYPDIELVLMDMLSSFGPTVTATGTTVPAGTILIERIGGPDNGVTDKPRVQISFFGDTRGAAWQLCRVAQQKMLASCGTLVSGQYVTNVLIDYAETATPPKQIPEQGRDSRIVQIVMEFHLRRQWPVPV